MVLTVSISNIFKISVDEAVKIYFRNQESLRKLDGELLQSTEIEHTFNEEDEISCVKTSLTYSNFIPKLIRKIPKLEEPELVFEEECWIDLLERHYWIRLRNISWNDSVSVLRTCAFTPDPQNPTWTRFECDGAVEFTNWGLIGQGIEIFMRNNMQKIILQNVKLLDEKITEFQKTKNP